MVGLPGDRIQDVAPPLNEGRYRLLRELGAGGMARVFLAWDERLGVHRAIKVLDPALAASPSIRRRFENEARTMAQLHHPNVVSVHDVGTDGERVYIVMEVVDGGSLVDRVQRLGPLAPRVACEVLSHVLAALDAAHQRGVVHRDVKPHNVLLARDGGVKVTDFGIAQLPDDLNRTRTGAVMGTLPYMSPEQRTDAKAVGPATDVYAAGATLYAIVTNKDPHDLWSSEIQETAFVGLPDPIREILLKACRYRAEERYASAAEMRGALLGAASRLPVVPDDAQPLVPLGGRTPVAPPPRESHTLAAESFDGESEEEAVTEAFRGGNRTAPTDLATGGVTASATVESEAPKGGGWVLPAVGLLVVGCGLAIAIGVASMMDFGSVPPVEVPPAAIVPVEDPVPEAMIEAPVPEDPQPAVVVTPKKPPEAAVVPAVRPAVVPVAAEVVPEPVVEVAAEPEPAAVAPVVAAPGPTARLFVNTRPAGTVWLDGEPAGATPLDRELPYGPHRVELKRADGSDAVSRTFDVQEGPGVRFCWDFEADAPCAR